MTDQPRQIGGGRRIIGDLAPKLAELTDDVLFDDVWNRPELADQLRFHLGRARDNGVTETELIEAITHLAFYTGWPKAMTAISLAKDVLGR